MLSQLQKLSQNTDGRYASDDELRFIADYLRGYGLRLQTYQRLHQVERDLVEAVYQKMQRIDPSLFVSADGEISAKWRRDTIRVLRYSALAMLMNDPDSLREQLLYWMQTIMRAFGAQRSCKVTYEVMQEMVNQYLTPEQSSIFCPFLEVNQQLLGIA